MARHFPRPIQDSILTVYFIPTCPYCKETIETLQNFRVNNKSIKYCLYDITGIYNNNLVNIEAKKRMFKDDIKKYYTEWYIHTKKLDPYTHSTFPFIFLQGKLIGGNDDLNDILEVIKLNAQNLI